MESTKTKEKQEGNGKGNGDGKGNGIKNDNAVEKGNGIKNDNAAENENGIKDTNAVENGNGLENDTLDEDEDRGTIQFNRKDGIEKDGYICFPVAQEQEVEEEAVAEVPVTFDLGTCPEDPRFQQQNKTKWCYRMYVDYHSCRHLLGNNAKQCNYFYRCYNSICPNGWIEKWDDQREQGTFPCDTTKGCPNLNAQFEENKTCP